MQELIEVRGALSLFEGEMLGEDGVEGVFFHFIA
jgi:hypothetical protein